MIVHPGHIACIVGGSVAGSEAAHRLAERGIYCVVIEQEALPYGKIEWGLPKWHDKLRDQEEGKIDEKLSSPYVSYVPSTRLGRDIPFESLLEWGFSAVLLATGAWRDRPLGVPGVDEYIGRGFYYQNPFVTWFNDYHAPEYKGPQCEIHDDAIVVGGGLASLDVVKILMLETVLRELTRRGIESDLFTLEREGIPAVLDRHGLSLEQLGLKGCTLYYRRRVIDMPLLEYPDPCPPERRAKVQGVRQKLLQNFLTKYLFRFQPCHIAVDKIVGGDRLAGLVFQRTEITEGRVVPLPGTEYPVPSPLVISSIGSIPEPLPGLPMRRELLSIEDSQTGKLEGFENVFCLGNSVTGRGNIRASFVHGRQVGQWVRDRYLGWSEEDYEKALRVQAVESGGAAESIASWLMEKKARTPDEIRRILERARELQRRVGYDGNYDQWIARHRPTRLEELLARR